LGTVLDFAFVPEFLVATSLLEPAEVCRTELKPFLTIFGTGMRATVWHENISTVIARNTNSILLANWNIIFNNVLLTYLLLTNMARRARWVFINGKERRRQKRNTLKSRVSSSLAEKHVLPCNTHG
jgi:hypothetical protein